MPQKGSREIPIKLTYIKINIILVVFFSPSNLTMAHFLGSEGHLQMARSDLSDLGGSYTQDLA